MESNVFDPDRGISMRRVRAGTGLAVFFLFFGLATLEAFQKQDWIRAAFWVAIGLTFLVADNLKKRAPT
jgi:hypothetical protein